MMLKKIIWKLNGKELKEKRHRSCSDLFDLNCVGSKWIFCIQCPILMHYIYFKIVVSSFLMMLWYLFHLVRSFFSTKVNWIIDFRFVFFFSTPFSTFHFPCVRSSVPIVTEFLNFVMYIPNAVLCAEKWKTKKKMKRICGHNWKAMMELKSEWT